MPIIPQKVVKNQDFKCSISFNPHILTGRNGSLPLYKNKIHTSGECRE